jgi:hypothetical protein
MGGAKKERVPPSKIAILIEVTDLSSGKKNAEKGVYPCQDNAKPAPEGVEFR